MADFGFTRLIYALASLGASVLALAPISAAADYYNWKRGWNDGVSFVGVDATQDDRFDGVAIADDGSVYAVGTSGSSQSGPRVTLVAKFTRRGELNSSFGDAGVVKLDLSSYQGTPDARATEEGRDVVVQSDGRAVVVARSRNPGVSNPDAETETVLTVFRLEEDGSPDETFGVDGLTQIDIAGEEAETAFGIEVDDMDRIYIVGHGTALGDRTDRDRYGFRLTPDGHPDVTWGPGFGGAGVLTADVFLGSTDNQRRAFTFPDGSSVAAGYTALGGRNQIVLVSVDPNGVPNTDFSTNGVLRFYPLPLGMAEAYGVVAQSDGSLVSAGYGRRYDGFETPSGITDPGLDLVAFRVKPNGEFDTRWGKRGALVYNIANFRERARSLVGLPNDSILMAGTGEPVEDNRDAMLLLVNRNGKLDRSFDRDVHKLYDFGGTNEEFRDVALSPSGRFVAAVGFTSGGSVDNVDATVVILRVPRSYRRNR